MNPNDLTVSYTLKAQQDDLSIHGNASAIDDVTDRENEVWILSELEAGNVWAWAAVTVTAELTIDGETYNGRDTLGACSYQSEADFRQPGGYYDDMRANALEDLKRELAASVLHGNAAARALDILNRKTVTA